MAYDVNFSFNLVSVFEQRWYLRCFNRLKRSHTLINLLCFGEAIYSNCKHHWATKFSPRRETKVQVIWLSKKNKRTKEEKRINIGFDEPYPWSFFKKRIISLSLTNLWLWAVLGGLPIVSINKTKLITNK